MVIVRDVCLSPSCVIKKNQCPRCAVATFVKSAGVCVCVCARVCDCVCVCVVECTCVCDCVCACVLVGYPWGMCFVVLVRDCEEPICEVYSVQDTM